MNIGLDLGTTNVKAVLVDDAGRWIREAGNAISLHTGPGGAVEQDMGEVCRAAVTVLKQLRVSDFADAVQAIGISAQGGALQVVDGVGAPVGPVIGWMDNRGAPWNESLTPELGPDWFARHTGHPSARGAVGQVLRLCEEKPGLLSLPKGLGFVGDVVVSHLCGVRVHDATSLSIAGLYNPELRLADPELLARIGLVPEQLPVLRAAVESAGPLSAEVAARTGLPAGLPVLPAVHDQYAAAVGSGILAPGDVMVGTGTAWVLLAVADQLAPPAAGAALVCTHIVDGLYGQMLAPGTGGSAFDWAVRTLGFEKLTSDELDARMAEVPAGCEGLRLIPLLSPLTPAGLSPGVHGAITGLQLRHGPNHILRAVVEGLACELARNLELLAQAGVRPARLVLTGGAAKSRVTPRIIADVTGLPVRCVRRPAASAHGAAVLARTATTPGASIEELAAAMGGPTVLIESGDDAAVGRELAADYVRHWR